MNIEDKLFIRLIVNTPISNCTDYDVLDNYSTIADSFCTLHLSIVLFVKKYIIAGSNLDVVKSYLLFEYMLRLLARLKKPVEIYVPDTFSPRFVAIIDYYKSKGVYTNMVQHGLIQIPIKYKSHADNYYVWSKFEYKKVRMFNPPDQKVTFFEPQLLNSPVLNTPDNNIIVVLNPYQGIGVPYHNDVILYIKKLSELTRVIVRPHPSDNFGYLKKSLLSVGCNDVEMSLHTWESDLARSNCYIFMNSTCILDIIYNGKMIASMNRAGLGYDCVFVWGGQKIYDALSPEKAVKYFSKGQENLDYYSGIIHKTTGLVAIQHSKNR
ncbi:MAG: hypothetical protein GY928_34990 [Colwellia sp.]|nr:hypothetical protein [Colwellia sp.]